VQLSPHFSLVEMTFSQTAQRNLLNNTPDAAGIERLRRVCETILEPVRAHFGKPVHVNSGYRSPALNALIPGSSNTSQHTKCEAVDMEIEGVANGDIAIWIRDGGLNMSFGQLILEFYTPGAPASGWVHCSLATPMIQNQVKTAVRGIVNGRMKTTYLAGLVI
jgi:zinc D-Ala-D-Ala carboxypeptidase